MSVTLYERRKYLHDTPQDDIEIILNEKKKFLSELQKDPIWDCEETASLTGLIIQMLTGRILNQSEDFNRGRKINSSVRAAAKDDMIVKDARYNPN